MPETKAPLASVMELVGMSFLVFRRSAGILIGYSAWLLLPLAASYVSIIAVPAGIARDVLQTLIQISLFVLSIWVTVTLTIVVANILLKQSLSSEQIAEAARARFVHAFSASVLVMLIELVGLILLIVPGIIVSVWYAFAQTETVLGVSERFKRCRQVEICVENVLLLFSQGCLAVFSYLPPSIFLC